MATTTSRPELGEETGLHEGETLRALKEFAARLTLAQSAEVSIAAWGLLEALERLA